MGEDLTKKLPKSDSDKLTSILTSVQAMEKRLAELEKKVDERLHDTLETNYNPPNSST